MQIPAEVGGQVYRALQQAIADSFVAGFRMVMLIAAGLALASALIAWLAIRVPRVAGSGSRVNIEVGGQDGTGMLREGKVAS
jgi:hypothetical protein